MHRDQVNALRVEKDRNGSARGLRGRERPEWTSPRGPFAGERPPGTGRYGGAPSGPVAQWSEEATHNRSDVGSIPTAHRTASWRETVCQYAEISGGAGHIETNKN